MCVVSAIYDYGQRMPPEWWDKPKLGLYQKLIRQAQEFDDETGQPDCEDVTKTHFLQSIIDRLDKLEKNMNAKKTDSRALYQIDVEEMDGSRPWEWRVYVNGELKVSGSKRTAQDALSEAEFTLTMMLAGDDAASV